MFFLGQIGLGWVRGQSKVALKKKGALFGHSSLPACIVPYSRIILTFLIRSFKQS
jgi:hypothetical protein